MTVKLLAEQHLEFLGLKGGCTGSAQSTLVKMPHCLKSHVLAHILVNLFMLDIFTDYILSPPPPIFSSPELKTQCELL